MQHSGRRTSGSGGASEPGPLKLGWPRPREDLYESSLQLTPTSRWEGQQEGAARRAGLEAPALSSQRQRLSEEEAAPKRMCFECWRLHELNA
jgi:hypothetical protein